ncbi:MAG: alternative ribosome rescue aminoacyl-tRNA hydrolase ArfB [Planctomycetota bacterium]
MPRHRDIRISDGHREVVIPADAIAWQFARSGGPGGQHVNRTSSKAVLRFDAAGSPHLPDDARRRLLARETAWLTEAGELVIASQVHREQSQNVAECLQRFTVAVRRALTPPKRRKRTRPPRSAATNRLDAKRRRSSAKRLRRRPED